MTVRPLQDRVLIKRVEEETKTAGGIIIPDNHKEKPAQGIVEAVGTGYRLQDGSVKALDVKKGDKVLLLVACYLNKVRLIDNMVVTI